MHVLIFDEQVVTFYAEDSLIPWIGFITCEALDKQNEAVQSPGFHLVMWNTVTAKLTFPCEYCRLQKVLEDAKNILRLVMTLLDITVRIYLLMKTDLMMFSS